MKNLANNGFKIDVVAMLKVMIAVAILLVPITFMLIDLTTSFKLLQGKPATNNLFLPGTNQPADFQAPVDSAKATDIGNVPKEEIDTLFNNLKK